MADSAPDKTSANLEAVFDKGYGRGAEKARRDLAEKLGLKTPDEIDSWIEEQKAAVRKKMEDEGRLKELLDLKEKDLAASNSRVKELEDRHKELIFESAFRATAMKAGIADVELALLLVKPEDRKVDEKGAVVGLAETVQRILKERPILKGGGAGSIGSPGSGGSGGGETSKQAKELAEARAQLEEIKKNPRGTPNQTIVSITRKIQALERTTETSA